MVAMALESVRGLGGMRSLLRREMLAFLPALAFAGYWYGLAGLGLVSATAAAVAWLSRTAKPIVADVPKIQDAPKRLSPRIAAEVALDAALEDAAATNRGTAAFVLGFDDVAALHERHGAAGYEQLVRRTTERMQGALRENDLVAILGGGRFAAVLAPVRRADLESAIQIAVRLQAAVEAPMSLDAGTVHVSAHLGFCLISRTPVRRGAAMLAAAEAAADEALRCGPGAIRAFSVEIQKTREARAELVEDVGAALEGGQILAHFLPQISTDTGVVTGFGLAPCWLHPERGFLPDSELLPVIDACGLRARLSEVLLYHGFSALRSWGKNGLHSVSLSLSLSRDELLDPRLAEKLKWELDRFEVAPERLRLEVSEAVASDAAPEMVGRSLGALSRLGCPIDLAGFGNGPAPILAIRKCAVRRLRIERGLVANVDTDPEQQKMMVAILSLAEHLGIETLADGVASLGEHAMLAQLGCSHVQGPGIARAMAYEDTLDWLERHRAKLRTTPRLYRDKR